MKSVIIILAISMLVGCYNPGVSTSPTLQASLKMEKDLADCKSYIVNSTNRSIYVVRCPNSNTSTTYQEGKTHSTVIVVDGVEYEKKQ